MLYDVEIERGVMGRGVEGVVMTLRALVICNIDLPSPESRGGARRVSAEPAVGGVPYSFVACISRMTLDHAPLSRRGRVRVAVVAYRAFGGRRGGGGMRPIFVFFVVSGMCVADITANQRCERSGKSTTYVWSTKLILTPRQPLFYRGCGLKMGCLHNYI